MMDPDQLASQKRVDLDLQSFLSSILTRLRMVRVLKLLNGTVKMEYNMDPGRLTDLDLHCYRRGYIQVQHDHV